MAQTQRLWHENSILYSVNEKELHSLSLGRLFILILIFVRQREDDVDKHEEKNEAKS